MGCVKIAKIFSLLAALFFSGQVLSADITAGIEYLTENSPPLNFEDDAKKMATGMNVDILLAMFKEMGSNRTAKDVIVSAWARAYDLVQDPRNKNMLFTMTRTPERDTMFKWVGPLAESTNDILVLKKNVDNVKIASPADYAKYKFGVIRDDIGEAKLQEAKVPDTNITRFAAFEPMLKSLQAGRFDAIAYNEVAARFFIKQAGVSNDDFVNVNSVVTGHDYFAFNKSVGDDVIAAHQTALDKVKANAQFMKELTDKYSK